MIKRTRLLTAEGTELVKQEVAAGTTQKLETMQEKVERTDTQDNYIKRLQSTLDKLDQPFSRPSKPIYQCQSNIIVAVSMGLQSPIADRRDRHRHHHSKNSRGSRKDS